MVFSSLTFLFAFLPLVLLAYYASPRRWRNPIALLASLFFYAWGAPRFVVVLFFSSGVDFFAGRELAAGARPAGVRKTVLGAGVALNILVLLYFKYANFLVAEANALLAGLGLSQVGWVEIALPIGISFFTFQKISYLVDVYRGTAQPAQNMWDYLLYVALFPQLIAGPIVRYHDLALQLRHRDYTAEQFFAGILRFAQGLGKKVLVANTLGETADALFGLAPGALSCGWAWLGVLAYAFQIYFDFSGYSDMAIGLGRLLGFEFLENFNRPYIARTFTEFWRRWHISLSNFMREYLYVPLGGNRKGEVRTYMNLWIVFLASGFWHGAAWNFVAWGAYHGFFLSLDKLLKPTRFSRAPTWLALPLTFVLVLFSWVLFRAPNLPQAVAYAGRMLHLYGAEPAALAGMACLGPRHLAMLLVALVVCFGPAWKTKPFDFLEYAAAPAPVRPWRTMVQAATAFMLMAWSAAVLATSHFNPFIYFRF